jgi:histidinol-phosphate aminotransferase
MTKIYINPDVKNTERVFPMQGRYGYHRYDMNENPEGLPKDFVDSVLKEITPEFLSIYPEPDRFLNKYAKYVGYNCSLDNLIATNGTDMAIRYILETFGEKGKNVVTVSPTFEMYWVNCSILGLHFKAVDYEKDMTIDIEKVINAIDADTRIVALVNPNNPMGNVYSEEEMQQVIAKSREVGAVVLIDEAYYYFYPHTFIEHAINDENVIVTRTFSKLFSIAATRMGVIITNPNLAHYIKNSKLTFDCNAVALLFAERIIDNPSLEKKLIEIEVEGKKFILDSLKANGYECKDCRGNFIFIKPHRNAHLVSNLLEKEKRILVHPYNNPVLKDYIRVSVGSKTAMQFFLESFLSIDSL